METHNKIEGESLSDKWETIILASGYSGIVSVFPKGEFVIGGSTVKIAQPGRWESHVIHNSNIPPVPSSDSFGYLYGVLESASAKKFPNTDKPINMDILAVNSLDEVSGSVPPHVLSFEENLKDVCSAMFGVVYQYSKDGSPGIEVAHVILLPKNLQSKFIQDCLINPEFCKELTEKLLNGVDEVLPHKQPDSIIVLANKKEKVFRLPKH